RKYLDDLKTSLTSEEVQAVERSLRKLEEESASLAAVTQTGERDRQRETTADASTSIAPARTATDADIRNASYVAGTRAELSPASKDGATAPSANVAPAP